MTYTEAVEFLVEQLPMFQQQGASAYRPGLDSTRAFSSLVGDPHTRFACVHVGGTNGKGSTSAILCSVLRASGYRVGLYTSPHLLDFRERIKVDDQMISQEAVARFVGQYQEYMQCNSLSFFEATTIMAFSYFAEMEVDIAVIEVGLGGRLDSTNIITPVLSVITNIDLDHTAILGSTIREIATEKGGIIKAEVPVVVGESKPQSDIQFIQRAKEVGAQIIFADKCYKAEPLSDGLFRVKSYLDGAEFELKLSLEGVYQAQNLVTALAALDILSTMESKITRESVEQGLENAKIRGRWEVLSHNPMVVCDTAHNVAGIKQVVAQLQSIEYDRLWIILAMVSDKDINGVLELLPKDANYFFTQAHIPRAMNAARLKELAENHGLSGDIITLEQGGVAESLSRAKALASVGDLVFVGGSTFTVAEILG